MLLGFAGVSVLRVNSGTASDADRDAQQKSTRAMPKRNNNALLPDRAQQETALLPAPFGAPTRGTGPLRLALAGATRSGSAGVGSAARDPLARLRRIQVESIGTTINFRPAAITHCDIAASALLIASRLALTATWERNRG